MKFIIQKHAGTRLHYDFHLEIGDKLHSWSMAKGPTLDPSIKRLAVELVDHDLTYREFEGVIPEGKSGAGAIMLWDAGTYIAEIEIEKGRLESVDEKDAVRIMQEGVEKGMLKFSLFGAKVNGSFAFVKTKGFGPKNSWLMIKHKDSHVQEGFDAAEFDFSATTKRNIGEING